MRVAEWIAGALMNRRFSKCGMKERSIMRKVSRTQSAIQSLPSKASRMINNMFVLFLHKPTVRLLLSLVLIWTQTGHAVVINSCQFAQLFLSICSNIFTNLLNYFYQHGEFLVRQPQLVCRIKQSRYFVIKTRVHSC